MGEMAQETDTKGVFPDINAAGSVCGRCYV